MKFIKKLNRFGLDFEAKLDVIPAVYEFVEENGTTYWRYFNQNPCAISRFSNNKIEIAWGDWNNRTQLDYQSVNAPLLVEVEL